jgi:hypothetical protein
VLVGNGFADCRPELLEQRETGESERDGERFGLKGGPRAYMQQRTIRDGSKKLQGSGFQAHTALARGVP